MPLPAKVVTFEIPGNLWQPLRREALRVDRKPQAILLQVLIEWLQALPDRDAPPATQREQRVAAADVVPGVIAGAK